MGGWIGLGLFPLIAATMILTGAPAFIVLIGAAGIGAAAIVALGDGGLLGALPGRLINLMESDLLQALPLFVTMGALINRTPLADILFRAGVRLTGDGPAAPRLAALTLGALLAPMNGSVGASVAVLSRSVGPMLAKSGLPAAERTTLIAVASTLGVVIPPSLVLIFLGDAMMEAHTIASNLMRRSDQIINTRDIFRAAVIPAGLTLVLWAIIQALRSRGGTPAQRSGPIATGSDLAIAALTALAILGLLGGVAIGAFYAVEAAAMGSVALLIGGWASGALRGPALKAALAEGMAISGALFALLIGATTFTLMLRILGADRLLTSLITAAPGGQTTALVVVLGMIALSALVLDAFEIVFVLVPIAMPSLLAQVPDAAWAAALTILILQASFLIPPFGYAVMMTRGAEPEAMRSSALAKALLPFVLAQALVIGLTVAFPQITHLLDKPAQPAGAAPLLSDEEVRKQFDAIAPDQPEPPTIDFK